MWNNVNKSNTDVIKVPKGKEKEIGAETQYDVIITEIVQILEKLEPQNPRSPINQVNDKHKDNHT